MTGDELISSDKKTIGNINKSNNDKKIVNDFGGNLKNIYIVKDN